MEVTALCIRLLINVLFLLCALDQKADSVFLRVDPNRLQFFEYESVTFRCEGLNDSTGWSVVHKFKGELPLCTASKVFSCIIKNVYSEDSGEYWCEAGGKKKSNSTNIIVTRGSVILESPALPVMEGEDVTLRCRNNTTSSNLKADFYKDGVLVGRNSPGHMTIHRFSRSDEGLYKCRISGAGESAESRVTVRELHPETHPISDHMFVIFRNIFPIVLMALLLLLGLLHCGKLRKADVSRG